MKVRINANKRVAARKKQFKVMRRQRAAGGQCRGGQCPPRSWQRSLVRVGGPERQRLEGFRVRWPPLQVQSVWPAAVHKLQTRGGGRAKSRKRAGVSSRSWREHARRCTGAAHKHRSRWWSGEGRGLQQKWQAQQ